jgi:hypothetical protein
VKKEIRFFMNNLDESEFIGFVDSIGGSIKKESELQWGFIFGNQVIQFLRCEKNIDLIVIGRIAIYTTGKSVNEKEAESFYRQLEKWIRSRFSNNLSCRNLNINGSSKPITKVWIGQSAERDLLGGLATLKQSTKGYIVFELAT